MLESAKAFTLAAEKARKVSLALAVLLAGLTVTGCGPVPSHEVASFEIPKPMQGRALVVPVTCWGKQYFFQIDTGTSRVVFDESFRAKLGEPVGNAVMNATAADHRITIHRAPDAYCGSINLKEGGDVFCMDLKSGQPDHGCDVRGIIGMSVLMKHVVRFTDTNVSFLTADWLPHPEWGDSIPLEYHVVRYRYLTPKYDPIITVRLSKKPLRMLLDTGCTGYGDLDQESARALPRSGSATFVDIGGKRATEDLVEASVEIAGHMWSGDFLVSKESKVGLDLLLSCRPVTIDFPNQKLYLGKPRMPHTQPATAPTGKPALEGSASGATGGKSKNE